MANPFAIAAALRRSVATIVCPHCGLKKVVANAPAHHRVCPRCKKHFPDPLSSSKARRRK
jgi:transposase-like protein